MTRKHSVAILQILAFTFILVFTGQSARADWGVSFHAGTSGPYQTYYYGDRMSSEYRRGYQVDDWLERGESSVTESPLFADGIRLASWATRYEEDYDYALASAIYFFEVPRGARSFRVKISYDGEANRSDLGDAIAGRVWIRRGRLERDYEEYYPSEGRYEDVDQPLYGDTFVLRARKHLEIIRLSADDHTVDGMMELHVVAEGQQRIDVKYIEVESYTSEPSVRVITKYHTDYVWRPWYDYTYWYFYTGPTYHFSDYYYVRYTYPDYHRHYVVVRKRYNDYLRVYYVSRPRRHVRSIDVVRVAKGTRRSWDRARLDRWAPEYEEARRSYRVTSMKQRRPVEVQKSRTRVRSVLSTRTRLSPAATRAGVTVEVSKQRRDRSVRTSSAADRARTSGRQSPQIETRTTTTRSSTTKVRRDDTARSPARTRSSTSSTRQIQQERSVRQAPARSEDQEQKIKRESTRTQTRESSRSSSVERSPSKSQPEKQSPPKKIETKKDDDDDDDDEEKKKQSTRSSISRSGSSTTKRRVIR